MIKIIELPPNSLRCRGCDTLVTYEPSDVRQQKSCGQQGCGTYNVITCPKCGRLIHVSFARPGAPR